MILFHTNRKPNKGDQVLDIQSNIQKLTKYHESLERAAEQLRAERDLWRDSCNSSEREVDRLKNELFRCNLEKDARREASNHYERQATHWYRNYLAAVGVSIPEKDNQPKTDPLSSAADCRTADEYNKHVNLIQNASNPEPTKEVSVQRYPEFLIGDQVTPVDRNVAGQPFLGRRGYVREVFQTVDWPGNACYQYLVGFPAKNRWSDGSASYYASQLVKVES